MYHGEKYPILGLKDKRTSKSASSLGSATESYGVSGYKSLSMSETRTLSNVSDMEFSQELAFGEDNDISRHSQDSQSIDSYSEQVNNGEALQACKNSVIQPYQKLLTILGWRPIFTAVPYHNQPSRCVRPINFFYPMLVFCVIILSFLLQFASCYRVNINIPQQRNASSMRHNFLDCQEFMISQYIIPDVLQLTAYVYAYYIYKVWDKEQLQTLIERVFLKSGSNKCGLSPRQLAKTMKAFVVLGFFWIVCAISVQILHVISQEQMSFTFLHVSSNAQYYTLVILMLLGCVILDTVYVTAIIDYVTQCQLLIYLLQGLCDRVRERTIDLEEAIKDIQEAETLSRIVNYRIASCISLLLFNLGLMAVLDCVAFADGRLLNFTTLMYMASLCGAVVWICISGTPFIQAARLNSACRAVLTLGHEIRSRPFGFQDTQTGALDSFLLFTSTITFKAKLFRTTVNSSFLCVSFTIISFTLLFLFQLEFFQVWN
ncbi:uncharacterized protein LOC117101541 [Anneissia japonica]|uniref:uncharacterized protein LOC117101541 n=1 Tax=Anneissia japonica TaxID=1529436 RepID=UPI0014257920|nr:uncharacterized protein LOC117101541 [Anneissia japonica]